MRGLFDVNDVGTPGQRGGRFRCRADAYEQTRSVSAASWGGRLFLPLERTGIDGKKPQPTGVLSKRQYFRIGEDKAKKPRRFEPARFIEMTGGILAESVQVSISSAIHDLGGAHDATL